MKVGPLDEHERIAFADFFGLERLPGEFAVVDMDSLEPVVSASTGSTVRSVVEQLVGPIGDRAAERREEEAERNQLWDWLTEHDVVRAQPALLGWAAAMRRAGLIRGSVSQTRAELDRALLVISQLPGAGIPLPVFADSVLRNPHALDEGARVHGMVVKALAALFCVDVPADSVQLRKLWERAGLADDELSSTVLAAGLRGAGESAVDRILSACTDSGCAAVLTLQQLRAVSRFSGAPERVAVVENPSVMALALRRFGDRCPPLICISGWPSSAGVRLLQYLRDAGTELHYHGDFDGEGLRIAANVVARLGALPWRMSSADYLAAVDGKGPPVGRVTGVPWDSDLAAHLLRLGVSVPEERVADGLLDELARLHAL
ncbi:TIGR02679 family protein [Nocardia sp. SYP-A9097]|uniref:TIGR02679 family protein n=1 Tax=Nocardia sp. SYP-A9097 TaxID=2663237 RepID=UPI002814C1E6|nr:TIGR02679 family protein [Nocardia sp. SYP-A9097]